MLEALLQDVRLACRHLRRSPGFAGAAISTLAFGIGANMAMFSVLNALVLRQLPIKDPHGLIGVSSRNPQDQLRLTLIPAVGELTREDGPLQQVCGYNGGAVFAIEANGAPTQAIVASVTGQCFTTFGVAPILGRAIEDADVSLSGPGKLVAVIGHRFWTRMFGADPQAIGKTIRAEGVALTVIGVLPPGFGGLHADAGVDVFAPFDTISPARPDRRPGASHILGRLRPGLSLEQAAVQLATRWPAVLDAVVPAALAAAERESLRDVRPRVERMGGGLSFYRDQYARPLTIIIGLTGILLLLACVNLGGLLLSRLMARGSEIGVRLGLGGSRWRIARQMLVENVMLSVCGAALAVPVSFAIVVPLASWIPSGLVERSVTFTPDLRVFGATALIGVSAGILMSVLPIWIAGRRQAGAGLTWDRTIARTTSRWAAGLLVAQVALSVVMLVGAGLLARSLDLLQRVDAGVRPEGVLIVRMMPLPNAYRDIDNASYYPALLEKVASLPGVRSVGFARVFPRLIYESPGEPMAIVGDAPGDVRAQLEITSPGFFETVGIPLLAGRFTSWSDTDKTPQVVVVSERLARALAPQGDVLGRRVRFGSDPRHQDVVVVGVVRHATLGNPRHPDLPVFYRPMLQAGRAANYSSLAIATGPDGFGVAAGVRRVLSDAGREYAHDISTLEDLLARAPASERIGATLAGAVAGLAVLLAFTGVFGSLAYAVSRRTREIGLRVALGAEPGSVVRMVMRDGLVLTLVGVAVGLPAAFLAARGLKTLMFGVTASDPFTFAATIAFFSVLGVAAGIIPARRAAGVDPMIALRAE